MTKTQLHIDNIQLLAHVGQGARERSVPQAMRIDITITFKKVPRACYTDQLADTVCYDQLVSLLVAHCHGKSFALIEGMAYDLFNAVKRVLPRETILRLSLTKLHPPVAAIKGSSSFSYEDEVS